MQGTLDDPKLPPASVDLALMVDVYHEFSQPQAMLRHLREALKPGGRLVLLEYRKEDPTIPIKPEHKMSVAEAKMEVEAEGFTLSKVDEALPRQHILIFTVKPDPEPSALAPSPSPVRLLFTEPTFLFLFLPVLLGALFPHAARASTRRTATGCCWSPSVIFYAKGGGAFTWLMLGSIAFNYWMAIARRPRATARRRRARRLAFAVDGEPRRARRLQVRELLRRQRQRAAAASAHVQPIAVPRVLLPIGISFFTFHAISYVVDVYRRDATAQKSPVHAALYLLLFPQLIAGPIIRYRDIADQLARRVVTLDDFAYGVRRFVIGLGKKVLIANVVAGPADKIFAHAAGRAVDRRTPGSASSATRCRSTSTSPATRTWRSASAGCSASAFPRTSAGRTSPTSVQEFWRRWHISLSTWFRDYLYIPLGGNRVSPARRYRNLVTVFFLCGLWHGASWNFVIWGLWHGTFLVDRTRRAPSRNQSRKHQIRNPRSRRAGLADLAAPLHAG